MHKDIDFIEEISRHINDIKKNKELMTTSDPPLLRWKEVTGEDLFEVVKKEEGAQEEIVSKMDINLNKRICDICKNTIILEENLSGLVVHDSHFLCEKCCQESSKEDLDKWTSSRMANPGDLKPVALWLMKEKNKNQLF